MANFSIAQGLVMRKPKFVLRWSSVLEITLKSLGANPAQLVKRGLGAMKPDVKLELAVAVAGLIFSLCFTFFVCSFAYSWLGVPGVVVALVLIAKS